jgi:hypothetical protein
MAQALKLHPDSICEAVTRLDVVVMRQATRLSVRYVVHGTMAALRIPAVAATSRTDELWQHTCCEAFIGTDAGVYYEFNWSPATQWAAYKFSGYRAGMANADTSAPIIAQARGEERFEMQATIDCESLGLASKHWRLGVTAVIEEMNGRKSYWALAHPPGKPDFHHADGFVMELEA